MELLPKPPISGTRDRQPPLAVITGASDGIGALLALRLAGLGWRLRLILRPSERAETVRRRLGEIGGDSLILLADLADQRQLSAAIGRLREAGEGIDMLFNNAGIMHRDRQLSAQGHEMHAEINLLAPYRLMRDLRPLLGVRQGIVVNTSSQALRFGRAAHLPAILNPRRVDGLFGAYADSKLALTVLTFGLAREFSDEGIVLRSVHPGVLRTKMTSGAGMPWWLRVLGPLTYGEPERGAARLIDAADRERHPEPGAIHLVRGENGLDARRLPGFRVAAADDRIMRSRDAAPGVTCAQCP